MSGSPRTVDLGRLETKSNIAPVRCDSVAHAQHSRESKARSVDVIYSHFTDIISHWGTNQANVYSMIRHSHGLMVTTGDPVPWSVS